MKSLFFALAALAALASSAFADTHHHPVSNDRPSTHGMLVFGTMGKVYVSHLPMFHSPHDYQLIAELELPEAAKAVYQESLAANPQETIYTLVPETFVLPELVAHPRPFTASLVRGHFERGGSEIAGNVTVSLGKILHFRKFDKKAARPAHATYLLFGDANESFVAHLISARPDFDHVVKVNASLVREGEALVLTSTRLDDLKPIPVPARLEFSSSEGAVSLQPVRELYLEHGDLR